MRWKTLWLAMISILFVLGIAACAADDTGSEANGDHGSNANNASEATENNDNGDVSDEVGEQEEVEIRFAWWGALGRNEIYNEIADLFEEKYPHITIVREFAEFGDYFDRLATQTAGGNAPDVMGMHQFHVSNYANRGALLNLNDYVESGIINLEYFPDEVVDAGKLEDEIVMIAQGVTMTGMGYNPAIFDEFGVDYPDMDWTYEEFVAKAKEINSALDSDDHWGSTDISGSMTPFQYYVQTHGYDLFDEDGQPGFDREIVINWFTMWDELRQEGVVPDAETAAEYGNLTMEEGLFVNGRVAIHQFPVNQLTNHKNYMDGEVHMVRHPTVPERNGEFIEGAFLAVAENSEHPEEAAMFIDFFVNSEDAVEVFKLEQGALGSTKMNEHIAPELDSTQQEIVEFVEYTSELATRLPFPPPHRNEFEQALGDAADSVAFGQSTIEEAADRLIREAENMAN